MGVFGFWVDRLATGIDVAAVIILTWGVLRGLWWFGSLEAYKIVGRLDRQRLYKKDMQMRGALGGYLLLGLEFMIASDIIHTVISHTMEDLLFLGGIVIIRTVISFFLTRELAHNSSQQPSSSPIDADASAKTGKRRYKQSRARPNR